ncbi:MAG: hypothetical protein FWD78_09250 [Treponema sp.]|nr:hypothetical protein [Treponema sp.]
MKTAEKISIGLHIFIGAGALAGGMAAILNPFNPMGLDAAQALKSAPFKTFLVPGIFLFSFLGLGNLFAALAFFKNWKLKPWISGFFAAALVIWIAVQCFMLQGIAVLHVIFFLLGCVQGILALFMLVRDYLQSRPY